ncbi:MAG: PH domain-containing protein [Anaerolineae bacterium]|nr:PH domain-containing protein [Anaerolineae bacterium]
MDWRPRKLVGLLWGLGLLAALAWTDYSLLRGAAGAPVSLALFGRLLVAAAALVLTLFVAYSLCGLASLAYRIERNGIIIRWAAGEEVVPMPEIVAVEPLRAASRRLAGGIGWPGCRFGQGRLEGVGRVQLYATQASRALLIRTRERSYVITPANVDGFMSDYHTRRLLGPIARWKAGKRVPAVLDPSIRHDRLAGWLGLAGLLVNLGLFGFVAARYPQLAPRIVLSFDPRGLADRIGASTEVFLLPGIGLAILLVNAILAALVHRRERILALLLLCNTLVVQALAWIAARRLVL